MLTKEQAAAYCGISVPVFVRRCPVVPVSMGDDMRLNRYDVKLLDAWLDGFGPGVSASTDDFWLAQAEASL
jgi:hypothetical protein